MTARLISYARRRGLQDAWAAVFLIGGLWTVVTWLQVGAEALRVRFG